MPRPFGLVVKNGSNARSAVSGRHALAVVGDVHAHEPVHGLDRHGHAAAARHRVAGVEDEVHQHLLELSAIGQHVDRLQGRHDHQLDVLAQCAIEHPLRLQSDAIDVDRLQTQMVVAAEDEQLAREVGGALGGADDLGHVGSSGVIRADLLADELRVVEDHGQQVVEVVRHAAGELAERLHALRALQRRLERLLLLLRADAVGDVGGDAAQPGRVAVAVDDRHGGAQQLARLAAELDELVELERVAGAQHLAPVRLEPARLLGPQQLVRAAADDLVLALAEHGRARAVGEHPRAVEVGDEDGRAGDVEHRLEPSPRLLQRLEGGVARGDVAAREDDPAQAGDVEQVRGRRLHVDPAAVGGAQAPVRPGRHAQPGDEVDDRAVEVGDVARVQQIGEVRAGQVVAAQLALERRADELDHALVVDHRDGLRARAHDRVPARRGVSPNHRPLPPGGSGRWRGGVRTCSVTKSVRRRRSSRSRADELERRHPARRRRSVTRASAQNAPPSSGSITVTETSCSARSAAAPSSVTPVRADVLRLARSQRAAVLERHQRGRAELQARGTAPGDADAVADAELDLLGPLAAAQVALEPDRPARRGGST